MSDEVVLGVGDKVRHRDAPDDAPLGTILALAGHTTDGRPIYQVGYRSPTGSMSRTKYPAASLTLVERADGPG